jgi:alpha/beta superfamily hydrolase
VSAARTDDRMRPVTFPNRQGHALAGILHEPGTPKSEVGVVLLSPGVKNRVAPHRLYVKLARDLASEGWTVLRFDFHGLGDSEGELTDEFLADLYGAIQVGRYIADTRAALDWMQQTLGIRRFVVGGLCGGAITGLLAGVDDPRVVGLLAIGIPVILDSTTIDPVRYMTAGQLKGIRNQYIAKLRDPRSWLRFITLKTDLRLLTRSLLSSVARPRARRSVSTPTPGGPPLHRRWATSPAPVQRRRPAVLGVRGQVHGSPSGRCVCGRRVGGRARHQERQPRAHVRRLARRDAAARAALDAHLHRR